MAADDYRLLQRSFFARDALDVARDLLGKLLRRDGVIVRITEVEAYRHPNDSANHCRFGLTERNAAMWGPPGRAYVCHCCRIRNMLNLSTDRGRGAAKMLIRSAEPVLGADGDPAPPAALRRRDRRF